MVGREKRSMITLKALTYAATGGIVAAPTTSLPERLGGQRNWDYRYCWLRDATLTLLGAMHAGYYDEAQRGASGFPRRRRQPGSTSNHVRHRRRAPARGVGGRLAAGIREIPRRCASATRRTPNLQLDVFGEIMDTYHQARRGGLTSDESGWAVQIEFLKHLKNMWRQPDQGIWEMRGPRSISFIPRSWLGSPSIARSRARKPSASKAPVDDWQQLREEIYDEVCERGFDKKLGTFVQAYDSDQLDANLLMLPCVGFLPVTDPRIENTIAAIEARLLRNGFVLRYSTEEVEDALPPGEGAFLACSFWLVDAYILQERFDDAERLFRRLGGATQRCRSVERGVRSVRETAGRQLSAGLFPSGTGE